MRRRLAALLLGLCIALAAPAWGLNSRAIRFDRSHYGPEVPLADLVSDSSLQLDESQYLAGAHVVIVKSAYELRLYSGDRQIKTYRIQLGKQPLGAKSRRGDARTPEGSYRICHHNRGSRYYMSLQIDYPNEEDIARGLEKKIHHAGRGEQAPGRAGRRRLPDPADPAGHGHLHPRTAPRRHEGHPARGAEADFEE